MSDNTMIIFDTETTGTAKPKPTPLGQQPYILEFAAVKVIDDEEMKVFDQLEFKVKPPHPLSLEIKEYQKKVGLVGLGDEDLKDSKSFPEHYQDLIHFFWGTQTMVAHNVAFDRNMLEFELLRMNKLLQFPWPINHICTVDVTKPIKGYRLSLVVLVDYLFNEPLIQTHRAMGDVEQLLRCTRELRKRKLL